MDDSEGVFQKEYRSKEETGKLPTADEEEPSGEISIEMDKYGLSKPLRIRIRARTIFDES